MLDGDGGDDHLEGEQGNDRLLGRAGNDLLYGLTGDDMLLGGSGNDTLEGGRGRDTLRGQAGDDRLTGGYGHDVLTSGEGNDHIISVDGTATWSTRPRTRHCRRRPTRPLTKLRARRALGRRPVISPSAIPTRAKACPGRGSQYDGPIAAAWRQTLNVGFRADDGATPDRPGAPRAAQPRWL